MEDFYTVEILGCSFWKLSPVGSVIICALSCFLAGCERVKITTHSTQVQKQPERDSIIEQL